LDNECGRAHHTFRRATPATPPPAACLPSAAAADGPLRFVFVVDSESDPAVPVLRELLQRREVERAAASSVEAPSPGMHAGSGPSPGGGTPGGGRYALRPRRAQGTGASQQQKQQQQQEAEAGEGLGRLRGGDVLIVSGPSTGCSQKIHK
jgi:hypothetical protein